MADAAIVGHATLQEHDPLNDWCVKATYGQSALPGFGTQPYPGGADGYCLQCETRLFDPAGKLCLMGGKTAKNGRNGLVWGRVNAPLNDKAGWVEILATGSMGQSHIAIVQRSHWITVNYREAYGLYACNGILFNHESPIRGETFVTRKITRALARISLGLQDCLYLGNLDAKRDWGHAKDYVRMQWLMLQQDKPDDFCIATGVQYSVRDFCDASFAYIGKKIRWQGEGVDEKGYDDETGRCIVAVDPRYFRPTEVETLLGDPSKAKQELGWEPEISFEQMVHEMMENDLQIAKRDALIKEHGYKTFDYNE